MKQMMITKYNPKNRNEKGYYLFQDEWTDFSEVGMIKLGSTFTYDEYLRIEKLYINAVLEIMYCSDIHELIVKDIEKPFSVRDVKKQNKYFGSLYLKAHNNQIIPYNDVPDFIRLILRNILWCRLEYEDKMFVHFGYDYYMFIGSDKECKNSIDEINASGLFVEDRISPYMREDT